MATVRALLVALIGALAVSLASAAAAQELGRVVSPILTLDRERLFTDTLFGQRVTGDLEAASKLMAAETRRIEASLAEEERTLTEQRASLAPEEFRKLADAFDAKVQKARAERDQAKADLQAQIDAARQQFFEQIAPVLKALVRERGAILVLDKRAILLSAADIDLTDAAIARIDAVLGTGEVVSPNAAQSEGGAAPLATDLAPTEGSGLTDTLLPAPTENAAPSAAGQ